MKKLIFLCVALLVAPAMAVVEFSGDGTTTAGQCSISYAGTLAEDLPRGIAVKLTCTGDIVITGMVADSIDPAFNCFIDWAYSNDPYNLGDGDPFADPAGPGVGTLPATEISLCMGVLDETENQLPGPQAAEVITLTVTGTAGSIIVEADTLRGPDSGVVGSELASNLPIEIPVGGAPECIKSDSPLYAVWEALGKPKCWCFARNCRGDADGKRIGDYWVQSEDLNVLIAAYFKVDGDLPAGGICADFDHKKIGDYRVQSEDLNFLIKYYFDLEGDIPECPKDWDGDADDDYNEWEIP